ncbi:MAG: hypothetical protein KBD17_01800 [Candidatus Pacebacteria bacterium]|nr:hypothetical protein [Candidatus Paceibacterota bacterium]
MEEPENVKTIGVDSPPPDGVIVILPVYELSGVTVKLDEATPFAPIDGPEKEKVVAEKASEEENREKTKNKNKEMNLNDLIINILNINYTE